MSDDIIKNLDTMAFISPTAKEKKDAKEAFALINQQKAPKQLDAFIKSSGLHYPLYNQLAGLSISDRSKEIIYWYLRGKSASVTAEILGISPGTVHTYIERLKKRLNCYSKTQILLKLIDSGMITPEDWQHLY